ncbi:MAG: DUF6796 family protein [Edaphobacter sp.]
MQEQRYVRLRIYRMILTSVVETKWMRMCCLSGLLGSGLFFAGDMLFCGTLSSGAAFHAFPLMAEKSVAELVIGGALGPVAALFSAFGMGIFWLTLKPVSPRLASLAAGLLAVMMLVGASYHAVFTCFGFAAKVTDEATRTALLSQIASLRNTISYPMYAAGVAGTLLVYWLALEKKTMFPKWLLIFLPTTLSLASDAFRFLFVKIPAPFGGIARGGWINGSFVLFFAIATCVFWRSGRLSVKNAPSNSI